MKSILIVLFGCVMFTSFSQLDIKENKTEETEIGSVPIMGTMWMSCKEFKDSSSVKYLFLYRNTKYTQISDYKSFWMESKEDFNQLYEILTDGNSKREEKELEIKEKDIDSERQIEEKYLQFQQKELAINAQNQKMQILIANMKSKIETLKSRSKENIRD